MDQMANRKPVVIDDSVGFGRDGNDYCLICPNCGFHCLHHDGVTVYDRQEDYPITIETFVREGLATTSTVDSNVSRNPSSRRDGVAIEFWCEGCEVRPQLTIEQHKGTTFLAWRF